MNKRIPIILGLVLLTIAVWLLITPAKDVRSFLDRVDNLGYDMQLRTYILTENLKPHTSIVIVDIDDESLQTYGRWPWQRSQLAELVTQINKYNPAIVAFDILFTENETNIVDSVTQRAQKNNLLTDDYILALQKLKPMFDEDVIFAKSLKEGTTILALGFLRIEQKQNKLPAPLIKLTSKEIQELGLIPAKGYISNVPILQNAATGAGFLNSYPDIDGILRRAPLVIEYQDGIYPSLALETVRTYLDLPVKLVTNFYNGKLRLEGVQIGANIIPTDEQGKALIPFIGKSYTFPYISAKDILSGKVAPDSLTGKIVLIGTTATGLGDLPPTAIQTPYPGVEAQASLINAMLQAGEFSFKPAWALGATVIVTIVFGLLAAFIFPYLGPRMLGIIIVGLPVLLFFINNQIWTNTGLVLSFLVPVGLVILIALLNILYGYLFETRRREHLKEMFGQYVPTKHIDEMLKSQGNYGLSGEERDMSVLFADIRNFTSISEIMSAQELVEFLNSFFTPMTEIIFKHRGTIDKYVGDLIMAFWGAPLKDKNHARHAIESALDMQKKVAQLRTELAAKNLPEIHIGVGINSGSMSVGDMGSRFRRNYTVLGDTVNLASRVEGLTKFYGVPIIVTEFTQANQSRFIFRKLDRVRVKGKKSGVEIYEAIGLASEISKELALELEQHNAALAAYFSQQWKQAEILFAELHQQHPKTKIYSIYLERLASFKTQTILPDWDGVFIHTEK